MKNLILNRAYLILTLFVSMVLTSCLKDDGYDKGQYGAINSNIEGSEYISIPLAAKGLNSLALESKAGNQTVNLFKVSYDYKDPAPADITVTLALNNSLVAAADPNLVVLPSSVYSLPSLTVVVPAGKRLSDVFFQMVINTSTLDPLKQYGIGFSITSVSKSGVQIPTNMKNVVFGISLKNKYDGVYTLTGYHNRDPYTFPYETEMHLVTVGPNSVIFWWPEVDGPGHPIGVGPGNSLSWYGSGIAPIIVFDPATNLVTNVYNNPPNATVITMFTGPGSRVSKYDPATKKITVDWNYNNNPLRAFFDNLTYVKPRP